MQNFVKQDPGQVGCLALLELNVLSSLICPCSTIIAIIRGFLPVLANKVVCYKFVRSDNEVIAIGASSLLILWKG